MGWWRNGQKNWLKRFAVTSCWTYEQKTRGNRNVVLQKDAENSMNGVCKQRRSLKENGNKKNTYNQKETDDLSKIHITRKEGGYNFTGYIEGKRKGGGSPT